MRAPRASRLPASVWQREKLGFLVPLVMVTALRCVRADDEGVILLGASTAATFDVAYSGCTLLRAGPICVLPADRALTLWLPLTGAETPPAAIGTGRGDIALTDGVAVGGGMRYRVRIPDGARRLTLPAWGWSLAVRDAEPSGPVAQAQQARKAGDNQRARRLVGSAMVTLSPEESGRAGAFLARLALEEGRIAEGIAGLQQSSATARRHNRISDAVNDGLALAYALTFYTRHLPQAREALEQAAALAAPDPASQPRLAYYQGLLAAEGGDLRGALQNLRRAQLGAERLALAALVHDARDQIAGVLTALGRTREALAIQRDLLRDLSDGPGGEPPCAQADGWTNLAWAELLASATDAADSNSDGFAGGDPEPALRQARAALSNCRDPFRRRNALTNDALYAQRRGDLTAAARHLQALAQTSDGRTPALSAWEAELNARQAIARGRWREALSWFGRQAEIAALVDLPDAAFRAETGRGEVFEAGTPSRAADAIAAYSAAETHLDQLMARVPLGEGRASFAAQHRRNVQHLVALHIRQGRADLAFAAARAARVRPLLAAARAATIQQLPPAARERWETAIGHYRAGRAHLEAEARELWALPADTLAAAAARRALAAQQMEAVLDAAYQSLTPSPLLLADPRPPAVGELLIMDFPIAGGVVGFSASTAGVTAEVLPLDLRGTTTTNAALALMQGREHELARAAAVRVLPAGPFAAIDYHALPWRGQPLGAQLTVSYSVDLGTGSPAGALHADERILIVADPTRDLPSARAEAALVAAATVGSPATLLLADDVSFERLMAELPLASLFHYAGHARPRGVDGMESALPLAQAARLLVGDVLALPAVPQLVVLSACEAGAAGGDTSAAGWDLASAFVVAGAQTVIAPVRPVSDGFAKELTALFYAALRSPSSPSPEAALRSAQAIARDRFPDDDVTSFRALVP